MHKLIVKGGRRSQKWS